MTRVFWIQQTFFRYAVNSKNFVEALAETISPMVSEPKQGEVVVPLAIDPILLSLVHYSVTQQRATSVVDLLITKIEMESTPPIRLKSVQHLLGKVVLLDFVNSEKNIVDPLTKGLFRSVVIKSSREMGLSP